MGSGWAYVLADDANAGDGWCAALHFEEGDVVDAGATCSWGECFRFPTLFQRPSSSFVVEAETPSYHTARLSNYV